MVEQHEIAWGMAKLLELNTTSFSARCNKNVYGGGSKFVPRRLYEGATWFRFQCDSVSNIPNVVHCDSGSCLCCRAALASLWRRLERSVNGPALESLTKMIAGILLYGYCCEKERTQ